MKEYSYDELVQLKQEGRIGWVEFIKASDDKEAYEKWCREHGENETENTALLFIEMNDARTIDNE